MHLKSCSMKKRNRTTKKQRKAVEGQVPKAFMQALTTEELRVFHAVTMKYLLAESLWDFKGELTFRPGCKHPNIDQMVEAFFASGSAEMQSRDAYYRMARRYSGRHHGLKKRSSTRIVKKKWKRVWSETNKAIRKECLKSNLNRRLEQKGIACFSMAIRDTFFGVNWNQHKPRG